jgi:catechol 2,3-dioxygenase-like lactoylglutathione lyase family enzyme
MLEGADLIGFVGVTDLHRVRQFYGQTLGLPIVAKTPFALVASAGDTMLRLTVIERPAAAPYTVLGWRVADIASVIDQLTESGVAFTRYEGTEQDERGVWTAPGGAKIAWFTERLPPAAGTETDLKAVMAGLLWCEARSAGRW